MILEVNGTQYTNFVSSSCELRLDSLSSSFEFQVAAPRGSRLPFSGGEACRVFVSDELALTGFIEVISIRYTDKDHTISIKGRDKTADLMDSLIGEFDDIRGDELSLKQLIGLVIAHLGLDIGVVDETDIALFNVAEDIAAPEPGENAYSFIQKYAKKRQVLLTSNAQGDVVIATNSGITAEGAVQHIIGASDNNVLTANYQLDLTGRFHLYKVSSGMNFAALNAAGETDVETAVSQTGIVTDDEIRKGRQYVIVPDASASDANCTERARWEADLRRTRGLAYGAVVDGFRVGGADTALWRLNRIYQIVDDFVGKIEPMLCNGIIFSQDDDAGSRAALEFVGQNAYTLLLEPDPLAEEAGVIGLN